LVKNLDKIHSFLLTSFFLYFGTDKVVFLKFTYKTRDGMS
jgi:hypothetical protein